MLDKLDLEVPRRMPFQPDFARAWNSSMNDEIFKKKRGGIYEVTGDLRGVGIPARLSCGHKHHSKLGPKVELIGAGEQHYSDWVATLAKIFKGDVEDSSIMRTDCTADVEGYGVDQLARAHICKHKQTNQDLGKVDYEEFRRVSRMASQTMYHGLKPRQIRIYDKTLHRLQVLLPALNRKFAQVDKRTFEQEYGYSPDKIVTRIERQMGAREPEELWGVRELGAVPRLMKCDPFEQLRFADDMEGEVSMAELDPIIRIAVTSLRERVERDGVDWTKAWGRGFYPQADSFRRFWKRHEHLIIGGSKISGAHLTAQFHTTLSQQLAA